MEQKTLGIDRDFIISFFLPDGMIDWFEVVNMTEKHNPGTTSADKLYGTFLNIYLVQRTRHVRLRTDSTIAEDTKRTLRKLVGARFCTRVCKISQSLNVI